MADKFGGLIRGLRELDKNPVIILDEWGIDFFHFKIFNVKIEEEFDKTKPAIN